MLTAEEWDDVSRVVQVQTPGRRMPVQKPHRSRQDYGTPREFLCAVEALIDAPIIFDLAASDENRKANSWFTTADDSLKQPWHSIQKALCKAHVGLPAERGWMWLNPPFGNISEWAAKCRCEKDKGAKILFLVPASVGSNWFKDHVHKHALTLALNPRIVFEGAPDPFPKDLILCLYGASPGFDVWRWKCPKSRTSRANIIK